MSLDIWQLIPIMLVSAAVARYGPFAPRRVRTPLAIAVLIGFLVWAPFTLIGFQTTQLTLIALWAVAAIGLNILTGYNGQISLGHGALVALGAYVAAILLDNTEQMSFVDANPWPFWTTIIVAGLVTAFVGLLLGIPALRLSGPYLAIATLAVAISFRPVMTKYSGLTGGSRGISIAQPQPPGFLADVLNRGQFLYFVTLVTGLLMLLLAWSLLRGPLGRAFVAVRDSEVAAEAMGINVSRTKVTAFTISAFFAGVAGALYMLVIGFISPGAIDLFRSINLLVVIVIGGLASLIGAIIGAAAMIFLPADAPGLLGRVPGLSNDFVERSPGALQGALVILTVLLFPAGLAGFMRQLERLSPARVLAGLKGAPGQVRTRAVAVRERLGRVRDTGRPERPGQEDDAEGGGA